MSELTRSPKPGENAVTPAVDSVPAVSTGDSRQESEDDLTPREEADNARRETREFNSIG